MKWPDWLLVFIGGGAGSVLRYFISKFVDPKIQTLFPLATMISNSLACLMIGFLFAWVQQKSSAENLWLFLSIGFCGGFSTFSSFTLANFQLAESGFIGLAALNIIGSLFLCLVFLYAGIWASKLI